MRKNIKTFLGVVILIVSVLFLVSCNNSRVETIKKNNTKKIVIWYWGDDLPQYANWYTKNINPNVEFNFVKVQSNEYYQKWILNYLSGGELPDIAVLEKNYRQNLIQVNDAWEKLEEDPYNVKLSDMFEYTNIQNINQDNELVSVEMGLTPALLAYKTDVAKDYLGISETYEMENEFTDWDTMLKIGEKINKESNGTKFLFSNTDEVIEIIKAHENKQIVNNMGVVDKTALYDVVKGIRDVYKKGLIDPKLFNDSDGIGATIAGNNVLFSVCPIWAPNYVLKVYDPKANKRWRLINIPGGNISMGGASVAISSKSNVKEEAFDFIKNVFLSVEGGKMMMEKSGALSCYKESYDDSKIVYDNKDDEFFGNQNIVEKYIQAATNLQTVQATQFNTSETQAIKDAVEGMIVNNLSLEDMVELAFLNLNKYVEESYVKK